LQAALAPVTLALDLSDHLPAAANQQRASSRLAPPSDESAATILASGSAEVRSSVVRRLPELLDFVRFRFSRRMAHHPMVFRFLPVVPAHLRQARPPGM
jgi:hypothetical protein